MSEREYPDLDSLPPPEMPEAIRPSAVRFLPHARWRIRHVLLALIIGIIVGPFIALAAIAISSGADPTSDPEPLVVLGFQAVTSLAVLYLLSRFRGSGSWKHDYGFQMRWTRHVGNPRRCGSPDRRCDCHVPADRAIRRGSGAATGGGPTRRRSERAPVVGLRLLRRRHHADLRGDRLSWHVAGSIDAADESSLGCGLVGGCFRIRASTRSGSAARGARVVPCRPGTRVRGVSVERSQPPYLHAHGRSTASPWCYLPTQTRSRDTWSRWRRSCASADDQPSRQWPCDAVQSGAEFDAVGCGVPSSTLTDNGLLRLLCSLCAARRRSTYYAQPTREEAVVPVASVSVGIAAQITVHVSGAVAAPGLAVGRVGCQSGRRDCRSRRGHCRGAAHGVELGGAAAGRGADRCPVCRPVRDGSGRR